MRCNSLIFEREFKKKFDDNKIIVTNVELRLTALMYPYQNTISYPQKF